MKRLMLVLSVVLVFTMLLGACAKAPVATTEAPAATAAATEAPVATEAPAASPTFAPGQTGASSFADTFGTLVREVNEKQLTSREAVNGLMSGENIPLHQAMIAMEEASVSFQLMVEVRNKLLDSYQELMRMQV
jgi:flagellar hook-basal body complex protein FliE